MIKWMIVKAGGGGTLFWRQLFLMFKIESEQIRTFLISFEGEPGVDAPE